MFTWWKRRNDARASIAKHRFRPCLEDLERREVPATAVNVGPTINISQAVGNQRTQAIAVNPANTNQVVAVSNVETPAQGLFEAWSTDGGTNWNTQFLFIDTTFLEAAAGDPQLAWDRFGNLFLSYTTTADDIAVARSIDGGQSFSVEIITITGGASHASIAVGPGFRPNIGAVWVSWSEATTATAPAHVETAVAVVDGLALVGRFLAPVAVPGSDAVNGDFSDITVGPGGAAMVTYQNGTGSALGPAVIWVNVDPDGMGLAGWSARRAVTSTNVGFARRPFLASGIPAQSSTRGIDAEPKLAWDHSNGPHRGRVYVVYVNAETILETDVDFEIFIRFSDNQGLTWSAPRRVNTDGVGTTQFNPAVALDQTTGNVAVAWFDARNDQTNNQLAEVWAAVSDTGAASFQTNFKVSADQSDSQAADNMPAPPNGKPQVGYGAYNKIAFTHGVLQVIWPDNSALLPFNPDPPRMDLATARVLVAPKLKVRVFFPLRWRLIDAANGVYQGQLTILNTSGVRLRGPFALTIQLPHSSLNFLLPANTRVGNTVTMTINSNLRNNVPLRILAQLANPLHKRLPTFLIGYAYSIT